MLQPHPSFARELRRGEEQLVDQLLRRTFGDDEEVTLVRKLRKTKVIAGETVLPIDDQIVGYYALSYMIKPKGWLCLAPVAIHPDAQRQGHGKRMIGLLTEWARLTRNPVVVLGNPDFYEKAGFDALKAAQLQSPHPIENTMLAGTDHPVPAQPLIYPPAFDGM